MWNSENPNDFIQLTQEQQQDMLYKSFERSSLIVALVRWTKFFCYLFIVFQLGCMIFELISPFAVNPPDVFIQLLFLTLTWMMIEVITIPVDSISDICTIDYHKSYISLAQKRPFYRRNKILASFDMIRAVGVSSRAPAIIPGLFSSSTKRFALVIQTYEDKVIYITDHNLSLSEANKQCKTLSQRLSGVSAVMGEKNMDLAISPETRELVPVPCKRSVLSLADTGIMLSLKVVVSSATSILLLFLAIQIIVSFAEFVFTTDLRLYNQPVIQLVFGPEKALPEDEATLPPAAAPETIELTRNPDLPAIWQASRKSATQSKTLIDSTRQIPATDQTKLLRVAKPEKGTKVSDTKPTQETIVTAAKLDKATVNAGFIAEKVDIITDLAKVATETVNVAAVHDKFATEDVTVATVGDKLATETAKIAAAHSKVVAETGKVANEPEKKQSYQTTLVDDTQTVATSSLPATYDLQYAPLPSRIPSVDLRANTESKVIITQQSAALPSVQAEIIISSTLKDRTQSLKKPVTSSILPGYGIEPIVIIGEKLLIENLPKPVFQHSSHEGTQILYENYSVLTDQKGIVTEIIITSNNIKEFKTPQNIRIGSPIKTLNQEYGPFTTSSEKPGIHYPKLGISFMPALHNPQLIGAIKIYKPATIIIFCFSIINLLSCSLLLNFATD